MGIINFNNGNVNKTSIDNDFIVNHMNNLSGDFVKIYLYMLMCNENHIDVTLNDIANKFGIFSSEVIKALNALSNEGLCTFTQNGQDFSLSFDKIKSTNANAMPAPTAFYGNQIGFNDNEYTYMPGINVTNDDISSSYITNEIDNDNNYTDDLRAKDSVLSFTNNVNNNTTRAVYDYMNSNVNVSETAKLRSDAKESDKYSVDELAFLLSCNEDISELKEFIEKTYGATFNASNLQTLVSIACEDYVPTSSLKTIVSYLYNNNSKITKLTSLLNALETKAIEINERGLTSDDEINEYLTSTSANYMAVVRRFGIQGRGLVPGEKTMLDKWLYTYKMPLDVINEAIDKTVKATGKASFDYCNRILTNWKDDGITTLSDLNKQNGIMKSVKEFNDRTPVKSTNKFNNYTIRTNESKLTDFEMSNLTKLMNKYGNK